MTRYAMGEFKPHTNRTPLEHMGPLRATKYADKHDLTYRMVRNLMTANSVLRSGYCGRLSFVYNRFYSYTTCVAQYHSLHKRWVFDTTSYGPTTASHLNDLMWAIKRVDHAPILHLSDVADIGSTTNLHYAIHSCYTFLLELANNRYRLPRRAGAMGNARQALALTRELLDLREAKVGASGEPVLYAQDLDMYNLCAWVIEGKSWPATGEALSLRNAWIRVAALLALEGV